ncbi:MAG: ribosome silencing factor [Alphaproteobacteria bacterium]|nr:ribosome silencing factor [Alphaproteobacteria bacterium]MCB9792373.1 ribosome silencing factor [Alphaproteobacteria bacterium]
MAELARSRKAEDLRILNMGAVVSFCDHFVLCNGSNPRQVRAIANHVTRTLKGVPEVRALGVEGLESARWVLVDYGEVVLHVFDRDLRDFYDLDGLWADAPVLELPEDFELPEVVAPKSADEGFTATS